MYVYIGVYVNPDFVLRLDICASILCCFSSIDLDTSISRHHMRLTLCTYLRCPVTDDCLGMFKS